MKKLSFILAVVFLLAAVSGICSAVGATEPATYQNVFSVKYGKSEGELNPAYSLTGGDSTYMLPTIYTVADDGRIYVVDRVNADSKEPIKYYDKDGAYLGTIVSEGRFIDEHTRIIDVKAVGGDIFVLNSMSELYRYEADKDKVTKYELGGMEDCIPYSLIYTHENRLVVSYQPDEFIAVIHFKYKAFSVSEGKLIENAVNVNYTTDAGGNPVTEFDWFGTKFSMKSGMYELPIGRDSLGEIVVKQARGSDGGFQYHVFDAKTGTLNGTGSVDTLSPTRMEGGNLLGAPSGSNEPVSEYGIEILHFNKDGDNSEFAYVLPVYSMTKYEEIDEKYLTARPYGYSLGPDVGPRDFAITENGDFYVVSYGETKSDMEILHFTSDGKYVGTIKQDFGEAKPVIPISQFAVGGNSIYTVCRLDDEGDLVYMLYEYDTAAKKSKLYDLPNDFEQDTLITQHYSFFTIGDFVIFNNIWETRYGQNGFVFDTKTKKFSDDRSIFSYKYDMDKGAYVFNVKDDTYTVPMGAGGVYAVIGIDDGGNLVARVDFNTYRRYAKNGVINGVADYDYDSDMSLDCCINVYGGKLYKARTTRKEYSIDEMTFNEKFLTENRYDANLDGRENTADAVFILKYSAGMIDLSVKGSQRVKADVNADGVINTADAAAVLKFCAGMK